ncbi:DUF4870 domain-containing protein [Sinomicrobium weinanense]|uniref:DUF4870 domain-containing protein n=1 Tax=Sinomicrobium weinanense TaxID=2842200 RepID=A0A926JS03_9FLAO|nr:DUF4870 domain-containing protein [Sinomicrobium weinanense]MBC9796294.1 DUF4870 domain-containing protein [Sinomicrobium weinanense]MBU3123225.1 DUF4870 domain-containing protein [Sinomicrobium weinanense]
MESTITQNHKNVAAIIHASTFSKYLIPFGNFLLPLVLWMSNKKASPFVEHHGKQAINFQVSILLYSIFLGILAIPLAFFTTWDFIGLSDLHELNTHVINFSFRNFFNLGEHLVFWSVFGILGLSLFLLNVICTIMAAMRAHEGMEYRYPLTISFLK